MTALEIAKEQIEQDWADDDWQLILAEAVVKLTEENEALSQSFADMNIGLLKYEEALKESVKVMENCSDIHDGVQAGDWLTKYSALIGGETK